MEGMLSKKFHKQTDFALSAGRTLSDYQSFPKEWKEIYHKEYPRFSRIELSKKLLPLGELKNSLEKRQSTREFDAGKSLTFEELSTILYYSAGTKPLEKSWNKIRRFYPSGWACYPLEVYLLIERVEGVSPGIYHYNVKENAIEKMTSKEEYLALAKSSMAHEWSKDSAVAFLITAIWDRSLSKYKNQGYRASLLEAGHLAQNIALVSSSLSIGCCNLIEFYNKPLNEALDIVEEEEDSLYMTVIGK